jgi:hypothetical protein
MLMELLYTLMLPLQLLVAMLLYFPHVQRRQRFWVRLFPGVLLTLLLPSLLLLVLYELQILGSAFWTSLIYSITSYFAIGLLAYVCFEIPLWDAFYGATCAYLTQHMAYCLNCLLQLALFGQVNDKSVFQIFAFVIVYVASYFLFGQHMGQKEGFRIERTYSLWTTLAALFVALVLSDFTQQSRGDGGLLYAICLLYSLSCCFFVLWGQMGQQKQLSLQHELDTQQQLWLKHKSQYELATKNVEIINRKCHDLKHQVAALRQVSDQQQRERGLRSLEESVMIYDSMLETGNQILDTVLTEKSLLCEEKGIELTCVADGASLAFMDAVDLYTIFGNALDNAIECVSKLPDPEQRVISLSVYTKANLVILQLENFYEGDLTLEEGLPQTSKGDRENHGYGLKSIRFTAEKYHGFLSLQTQDHIFMLRVTIPTFEQA